MSRLVPVFLSWGGDGLGLRIFNLLIKFFGVKFSLVFSVVYHHAKEVVCESPGLVDFAVKRVDSGLYLPDGQVKFPAKTF